MSFKCDLYWQPIPVPGTLEIQYHIKNGVFNVRKENDLRLHCTWNTIGNSERYKFQKICFSII